MFNIKVPRYLFGVTFFVFREQNVKTKLASGPHLQEKLFNKKRSVFLIVRRWSFFILSWESTSSVGLDFPGLLQ